MDDLSLREAHAFAQGQVLSWLILAFRPPTEESVTQLLGADLIELLETAGLDGKELSGALSLGNPSPELTRALQSEYVRLFVNARDGEVAHLEATAYLFEEGVEAQSQYLSELNRALGDSGLGPIDDARHPIDHLTMLLERLYYLEAALNTAVGHHPFAESFLRDWIPTMLGRLGRATPLPLYRAAGNVLALLLGLDPQRWATTSDGEQA